MTKHVFLIDVTRHKGPMQTVMQTARAHAESFPEFKLLWFHSSHQRVEGQGDEDLVLTSPTSLISAISNKINELNSNGASGAVFYVFSHDGFTLRAATKLATPNLRVQTSSIAAIKRLAAAPESQTRFQYQANPSELPLSEAAEHTRSILNKFGHSSPKDALLQNRLRGLLATQDSRARKNPRSLQSQSLIRDIVALGIKGGLAGIRFDVRAAWN